MGRNIGIPHYRRIMSAVLELIQIRETGAKLPSEHALAKRFNVARSTVVRALDELQSQGLIQQIRGSGTFSSAMPESATLALGYYMIEKNHYSEALFKQLHKRFAQAGRRLIVMDAGIHGENMPAISNSKAFREATSIIWFVSSHPRGIQASTRARRLLKKNLPLILINDTLGLTLRSRIPVDFIHFDSGQQCSEIIDRFFATNHCHPVLIRRSDVAIESAKETERRFLFELVERKIPYPIEHIWHWDTEKSLSSTVANQWKKALQNGWVPDVFILEYFWGPVFQKAIIATGIERAVHVPVSILEESHARPGGHVHLEHMADVCFELLESRLRRPHRTNLHVSVVIPSAQR